MSGRKIYGKRLNSRPQRDAYHSAHTPHSLEWVTFLKLPAPNVDVAQLELANTAAGKVKWHNHFGTPFGSFFKS